MSHNHYYIGINISVVSNSLSTIYLNTEHNNSTFNINESIENGGNHDQNHDSSTSAPSSSSLHVPQPVPQPDQININDPLVVARPDNRSEVPETIAGPSTSKREREEDDTDCGGGKRHHN
jgi:hypothetical protein